MIAPAVVQSVTLGAVGNDMITVARIDQGRAGVILTSNRSRLSESFHVLPEEIDALIWVLTTLGAAPVQSTNGTPLNGLPVFRARQAVPGG